MAVSGKWYKLDNAATIVPSTAKGADTRVFRLCCELMEEIDPFVLQQALDETSVEFPHLNKVLRKGMFWYYLDDTPVTPIVEKDVLPPCAPLYYPGRRGLLYRVVYYRNRISLEMFHVLADGMGAMIFFKRLITSYLSIAHGLTAPEQTDTSSAFEKTDDAFDHFYEKGRGSSQLGQMAATKAYRITGELDENFETHIVEAVVSAKAFSNLARKYNTTAGVLSASLLIETLVSGMKRHDRKYPVVISVPVNLRSFFPSETTRNFFGVINVKYHAKETGQGGAKELLETIIEAVKKSFDEQLQVDNVRATMNSYSSFQHNIAVKMVPLFIKDLGIGYISGITEKGVTATLSNLGRITMPDEFTPYINLISAFMATPNMQICISSFGDKMVFGASSAFTEHNVMRAFLRRLTSLGLDVTIATNDYDIQEENRFDELFLKKRREKARQQNKAQDAFKKL